MMKVLGSSQVSAQPITPPRAAPTIVVDNISIYTPKRPQDLYQAQQLLSARERLPRSARLLFGKAGKAIGIANMRAAEFESTNKRLLYQLQQLQNKHTKKRVQIDPNERFLGVEQIRSALIAAAASKAKNNTKKRSKKPRKQAQNTAQIAFETMCNQWQL